MDEEKETSICDRLSELPESLKCEVLLNLTTKDVAKTSVLSSRWRHVWKYVPALDLRRTCFNKLDDFVSCVDGFLCLNSESRLQSFKLDGSEPLDALYLPGAHYSHVTRWINTAVTRKVQLLDVGENALWRKEIPLTVYTCESLVYLKLDGLSLPTPKSVSLPSLKHISLCNVRFANDLDCEMLISGCTKLQTLNILRGYVKVLRVRSQTLLSFTLKSSYTADIVKEDAEVVAIDAPRLEYLELDDNRTGSFIIYNSSLTSLVKVNLKITFNMLFLFPERFVPEGVVVLKTDMIRKFLIGISSVKDMTISSIRSLAIIYGHSRFEPLPVFSNLSYLSVALCDDKWKMLPIFLKSCPNLKSLSMSFYNVSYVEEIYTEESQQYLLTSLEYVKMVYYLISEDNNKTVEMTLARYILEKSTILKKFTLILGGSRKYDESVILQRLITIPILSTSCQLAVVSSS